MRLKKLFFCAAIFLSFFCYPQENDECTISSIELESFDNLLAISEEDLLCIRENNKNDLKVYEVIHEFLYSNIGSEFSAYSENEKNHLFTIVYRAYESYGVEFVNTYQNTDLNIIPINYLMNIYNQIEDVLSYYLGSDEVLAIMSYCFAVSSRSDNGGFSQEEETLNNLTLRHLENLVIEGSKPVFFNQLKFIVVSNKIRSQMLFGNNEKALLEIKNLPEYFSDDEIIPFFSELYPIEVVGALSDSMTFYSLMKSYPEFHEFQKKLFHEMMNYQIEYVDYEDIFFGFLVQTLANIDTLDEMFFCEIPYDALDSFFDNSLTSKFFYDLCNDSFSPEIYAQISSDLEFNNFKWVKFAEFLKCGDGLATNCDEEHLQSSDTREAVLQYIYSMYSERNAKAVFDTSNILKILSFIDVNNEEINLVDLNYKHIQDFNFALLMATDEDRKKIFLNFNSIVIPEETWNDVSSNRYAASLIAKDLNTLVQSLYVYEYVFDDTEIDQKDLFDIKLKISSVLTDFAIKQSQNIFANNFEKILNPQANDPSIVVLRELIYLDLSLISDMSIYVGSIEPIQPLLEYYFWQLSLFDESNISTSIRLNYLKNKFSSSNYSGNINEYLELFRESIKLNYEQIIFQKDSQNFRFKNDEIDRKLREIDKNFVSQLSKLEENILLDFVENLLFDSSSYFKKILNPSEQIILMDTIPSINRLLVLRANNVNDEIFYEVISAQADMQLIKDYSEAVTIYPPPENFRSLQYELAELFSANFQVCEEGINDKITYITLGELRDFPVHTIMVKEGDAYEYLMEYCTIGYLPSLQSAYYLPKNKPKVKTKGFYGVGDPNFSQIEASKYANRGIANAKELKNLVSLSETYDEVVSISNLFPKRTLFLGNKASEIQLKAQQDFSNSITYFATHSVPLMSKISLQPGLALTPPQSASTSDDGLLTASEIMDMNFNNSYISLAACNTYQELYPGSEKFSGFAESFFAAGAKGLVLSMWDIESISASKFNTKMYDRIVYHDESFQEAIRKTSLQFIQDEEYNHPFFWGGYIYLGSFPE